MSAEWNMRRKEFLVRCAGAAAGMSLGLGASCGTGGNAADNTGNEKQAAGQSATGLKPACRKLGKAEIKVTEIGFGASRTMDPTLMNYAFEKGITFFDTGRSYYNGQNEVMVGKVFCRPRQPRCAECPLSLLLPGGGATGD